MRKGQADSWVPSVRLEQVGTGQAGMDTPLQDGENMSELVWSWLERGRAEAFCHPTNDHKNTIGCS